MPQAMKRWKPSGATLVLGLWFVAMLLVGSSLMAKHLVPLPEPTVQEVRAASLSQLAGPAPKDGRWMAVHVLYSECRCSKRIAEHLLETARPADVDEHVLLVKDGDDTGIGKRLGDGGFHVHVVTSEELAERYGIEAVPFFVLLGPDGVARYAGGYTDRKQGPAPRDLEIIAAAREGKGELPALPTFGCAVSEKLRNTLDPLRIP
jgi:hypothetical protein